MTVTAAVTRQIPPAQIPGLTAWVVGAVGTVVRGSAASRAATALTPAAGTSLSGCALLSPIYNEDLLRRKGERRTPESTRPADRRGARASSHAPTRRPAAGENIKKRNCDATPAGWHFYIWWWAVGRVRRNLAFAPQDFLFDLRLLSLRVRKLFPWVAMVAACAEKFFSRPEIFLLWEKKVALCLLFLFLLLSSVHTSSASLVLLP